MNIPMRIRGGDVRLEEEFLSTADRDGFVELKGHRLFIYVYILLFFKYLLALLRSVGGLRVSLYNAMSIEGVEALAMFMHQFQQHHSNQ